MRLRGIFAFALGSLLVAGCAGNRAARRLEGRYDLGAPGQGWRRVAPGSADDAWINNNLHATIYTDSNCAKRFDDDLLTRLLDRLTLGIGAEAPLREEPRALDGRDALLRVVDGNLDGVPVRVGAMVAKKDFCVYDLVYMAPRGSFEDGWSAFEAVIAGFRTRGS